MTRAVFCFRRMRYSLRITLLLVALSSVPAHAVPTRVPGTLVTLDPPAGFTPMERYPGFENTARKASIMVSELPGPALAMRQGMTRENLASRGMTLLRSEEVRVAGQTGLLLNLRQRAGDQEFMKWMLVTGDAKKTVMVVGAFPNGDLELSLPIRRAVLSSSWKAAGLVSKYEGLTFRVDPTPKLRLAGRLGNMLVFSESGKMEPTEATANDAMLIVGSSYAEVNITNVESFARDRAKKTERLGLLRDIQGRAVTRDKLLGYELTATANDLKSGKELRMYQLILADRTTYYLAQGFVTPENAARAFDQFRQVTGSFRRVRTK